MQKFESITVLALKDAQDMTANRGCACQSSLSDLELLSEIVPGGLLYSRSRVSCPGARQYTAMKQVADAAATSLVSAREIKPDFGQ